MLIRFAGAIKSMSVEIADAGLTDAQYKATVIVLMMTVVLLLGVITLAIMPVSVLRQGGRQ